MKDIPGYSTQEVQEKNEANEQKQKEATKAQETQKPDAENKEAEGGEKRGAENTFNSLDEFLASNKKFQSEYDRRLTSAQEKAAARKEKELTLSAEELAEERLKEREQEVERREAEQDRREFEADVKSGLIDNDLPLAFADVIASGATPESLPRILKDLKIEWDYEIREAIKSKARQREPRASEPGPTVDSGMSLAEFARNNRKVK